MLLIMLPTLGSISCKQSLIRCKDSSMPFSLSFCQKTIAKISSIYFVFCHIIPSQGAVIPSNILPLITKLDQSFLLHPHQRRPPSSSIASLLTSTPPPSPLHFSILLKMPEGEGNELHSLHLKDLILTISVRELERVKMTMLG
jgi:hypothetical protein